MSFVALRTSRCHSPSRLAMLPASWVFHILFLRRQCYFFYNINHFPYCIVIFQTMTSPVIRRSSRQTWANYASFGRDYLAETLGWSRPQLDDWLLSSTVHPHLVFWHSTCIERARRFNEGVEWINTGYFFKDCNLEEDVLLLCLGEGNQGSDEDAAGVECKTYANATAKTYRWTTVELWARSVWRITQDNCGKGARFEKAMESHPAAIYGIVFDVLALAFHNIASIGLESVWATIINSACTPTRALTLCTASGFIRVNNSVVAQQMAMDADPDTSSEFSVEQFEEFGEYESDNHTEDSDFSSDADIESESVFLETPKRKRGMSDIRTSLTAPVKAARGTKQVRSEDDREESPSKRVNRWIDTPPPDAQELNQDKMLEMFDENNVPITGYRAAATVQQSDVQQKSEEEPELLDEDTIVLRRDLHAWS